MTKLLSIFFVCLGLLNVANAVPTEAQRLKAVQSVIKTADKVAVFAKGVC